MRNKERKDGFTLIEIAVVIVILGVIAMLAFPSLFAQVERHRGQEAMNTMNLIKSNIESCGVQNAYNFANCDTWDEIGMDNPTVGNFTYSDNSINIRQGGNNFANGTFSIRAIRTTSADRIDIDRDADGTVRCDGTGAFLGFC